MRRTIIWISMLIFLLTLSTPILADEIEDHKNEAKDIKQDISETKEQIDRVKSKQEKVARELGDIEEDIKSKEAELLHIEGKLEETLDLLEDTKMELEASKEDAARFEALMADRLCAMYMMEGNSYLELLFGARSLNEFLDRFEMVKFMITYDNDIFDKMIDLQNAIQLKKAELEDQEEEIRNTKDEISLQKSLIEGKKSEKNQLMTQLQNEEQQYEEDLDALEQASKDLEKTIQRLLKEQEEKRRLEEKRRQEEQRRKEEERRREEESKKNQGEDSNQNGTGNQSGQKDQDRGSNNGNATMIWPAPGFTYISSGYGNRWHPIDGVYRFHTGIDIAGSGINGTNALAAADGVVILSQMYGSYGNCVIIDHGGGITSVYAHGSKLIAYVGQEVTAGQAVLKVGSTGASTGPHLHFEVRKNGSHVNPLPYLGR